MTISTYTLAGSSLDAISVSAHHAEAHRALVGLAISNGQNAGAFQSGPTPRGGIKIAKASDPVPPRGVKICEGTLRIAGNDLSVIAYRMPA